MATVELCDICGKPILDYENNKKYKVKGIRSKFNLILLDYKNKWVNISVHESCIDTLIVARDNQITNEMIMEEVRKKIIMETGNDK